ncbi:MAG: hypothetical protein Q7T93_13355 [Methylobacterium sp.]|uniref:hypothetical protein n=1 Tax=Methylobacterium sp. TaxID=409 RepID=UPI002721175F|nr:hypothetical protein [Methylobacterium sp.]MDO9427804.1 hypothetical protein [Methylobacterium sp.]
MLTPDLLRRSGEALHGTEEWRHALARTLGEHHPEGPRESLDPRRMARWSSGQREIPEWVGPVLARLLRERAAEAADIAREIEGG